MTGPTLREARVRASFVLFESDDHERQLIQVSYTMSSKFSL